MTKHGKSTNRTQTRSEGLGFEDLPGFRRKKVKKSEKLKQASDFKVDKRSSDITKFYRPPAPIMEGQPTLRPNFVKNRVPGAKLIKAMVDYLHDASSGTARLTDYDKRFTTCAFRFFFVGNEKYWLLDPKNLEEDDNVNALFRAFSHFYRTYFKNTDFLHQVVDRCRNLRSDASIMAQCISDYGPAFLPIGYVFVNPNDFKLDFPIVRVDDQQRFQIGMGSIPIMVKTGKTWSQKNINGEPQFRRVSIYAKTLLHHVPITPVGKTCPLLLAQRAFLDRERIKVKTSKRNVIFGRDMEHNVVAAISKKTIPLSIPNKSNFKPTVVVKIQRKNEVKVKKPETYTEAVLRNLNQSRVNVTQGAAVPKIVARKEATIKTKAQVSITKTVPKPTQIAKKPSLTPHQEVKLKQRRIAETRAKSIAGTGPAILVRQMSVLIITEPSVTRDLNRGGTFCSNFPISDLLLHSDLFMMYMNRLSTTNHRFSIDVKIDCVRSGLVEAKIVSRPSGDFIHQDIQVNLLSESGSLLQVYLVPKRDLGISDMITGTGRTVVFDTEAPQSEFLNSLIEAYCTFSYWFISVVSILNNISEVLSDFYDEVVDYLLSCYHGNQAFPDFCYSQPAVQDPMDPRELIIDSATVRQSWNKIVTWFGSKFESEKPPPEVFMTSIYGLGKQNTTKRSKGKSFTTNAKYSGSGGNSKSKNNLEPPIMTDDEKAKVDKANVSAKPLCFKFVEGKCRFGDKCRFSHYVEAPEIAEEEKESEDLQPIVAEEVAGTTNEHQKALVQIANQRIAIQAERRKAILRALYFTHVGDADTGEELEVDLEDFDDFMLSEEDEDNKSDFLQLPPDRQTELITSALEESNFGYDDINLPCYTTRAFGKIEHADDFNVIRYLAASGRPDLANLHRERLNNPPDVEFINLKHNFDGEPVALNRVVCYSMPKTQFLFDQGEIQDETILSVLQPHDLNGAPYCGHVVLGLCAGQKLEDIVFDVEMRISMENRNYKTQIDLNDAIEFGTPDQLDITAKHYGINFIIIRDAHPNTQNDFTIEAKPPVKYYGRHYIYSSCILDAANKTCFVYHANDHYQLMKIPYKKPSLCKIPDCSFNESCWLYDYGYRYKVKNTRVLKLSNGTADTRFEHKHIDKATVQDHFALVEKSFVVVLNKKTVLSMNVAKDLILMYFYAYMTPFVLPFTLMQSWDIVFNDEKYIVVVLNKSDHLISVAHANTLKQEAELGTLRDVSFMQMLVNTYINSDDEVDGWIKDTKEYMQFYHRKMGKPSLEPITTDLVHLSSDNSNVHVTPEVRDLIVENQVKASKIRDENRKRQRSVIKGAGPENIGDEGHASTIGDHVVGYNNNLPNHFVKLPELDEFLNVKINKPIADAPLGVVITKSPLGPGRLPMTDTAGITMAFALRSMSKKMVERSTEYDDFVTISKEFIDKMIDGTDLTSITEMDSVEFFKEHYRGKKPAGYIRRVAEEYVSMKANRNVYRKSSEHSCFTKMENSSKTYPGLLRVSSKPRLIMTMCSEFLVEFCQFTRLIDRWNDGPFREYQVKHMTPAEACAKVIKAQTRAHWVTDFSSFESSIDDKMLELERYAVLQLCSKTHFSRTKRAYTKFALKPRLLKQKKVKMFIATRNSGDITTSFGNGLISACVFHYVSKRMGVPFKFLGEGDDGITDLLDKNVGGKTSLQIVEELGFKLSSEVSGTKVGDTDFLSKRYWKDGSLMLNVGKTLNVFWVKNKCALRRAKKLFILRCMASSVHHMSPGHPILWALVERIGRETSGINKFRNWRNHLGFEEQLFMPDYDSKFPRNIEVNEELRIPIAEGAIGFPSIPIIVQLELERIFLHEDIMLISSVLEKYEVVLTYAKSLNTMVVTRPNPDETAVALFKQLKQSV